jgi:hypothetical protein
VPIIATRETKFDEARLVLILTYNNDLISPTLPTSRALNEELLTAMNAYALEIKSSPSQ